MSINITTQTDPTDGTLTTYTHGAHTMQIVTNLAGNHRLYALTSDSMKTNVALSTDYGRDDIITVSAVVSGHTYRLAALADEVAAASAALVAFSALAAANHGLTIVEN